MNYDEFKQELIKYACEAREAKENAAYIKDMLGYQDIDIDRIEKLTIVEEIYLCSLDILNDVEEEHDYERGCELPAINRLKKFIEGKLKLSLKRKRGYIFSNKTHYAIIVTLQNILYLINEIVWEEEL